MTQQARGHVFRDILLNMLLFKKKNFPLETLRDKKYV